MGKLTSVRNSQGFTLIELLIVVVIIGILAAIAIPQFASTREKAFDSAAKSDVRNMMSAQEAHFADNQSYTGASVAASTEGTEVTTLGFRASPQVALTVTGATNGYAITASHTSSTKSWCVVTTPGGNSNVHECGAAAE